ncbi:hypothetical protein LWI28_001167 [Acer negundo]|uniref:Uncharacterized protein n=1 Tax=Acer negundo TaxID=4023 RepID=A0AAD5JKY1_ACENE|nr:hypothetical protein LWI28_001167 [Acer negundo]
MFILLHLLHHHSTPSRHHQISTPRHLLHHHSYFHFHIYTCILLIPPFISSVFPLPCITPKHPFSPVFKFSSVSNLFTTAANKEDLEDDNYDVDVNKEMGEIGGSADFVDLMLGFGGGLTVRFWVLVVKNFCTLSRFEIRSFSSIRILQCWV